MGTDINLCLMGMVCVRFYVHKKLGYVARSLPNWLGSLVLKCLDLGVDSARLKLGSAQAGPRASCMIRVVQILTTLLARTVDCLGVFYCFESKLNQYIENLALDIVKNGTYIIIYCYKWS